MTTNTPERIKLPGGFTMDKPGIGDSHRHIYWPQGGTCILIEECQSNAINEFAATMNRPTDGLREALANMVNHAKTNFKDHDSVWVKAAEAELADTPQAPAAPPVLPSDAGLFEWARAHFPSPDAEATTYSWDDMLWAMKMYAVHRTAHQNAADDGWRDIETYPDAKLKPETEVLVGWREGPNAFRTALAIYVPKFHREELGDADESLCDMAPDTTCYWKEGWYSYYTHDEEELVPVNPTHWRPHPTPPRNGRVG